MMPYATTKCVSFWVSPLTTSWKYKKSISFIKNSYFQENLKQKPTVISIMKKSQQGVFLRKSKTETRYLVHSVQLA